MKSTIDLRSERLAQLLSVGRIGNEKGDNGPAELLRELLARPVSLDTGVPESTAAILGRLADEVRAHAGRALGDLILDAETSAAVLTVVKEYGKNLVHRARTQADRAAATGLYYAAIAAALLHRGERITRHAPRKLHEAFADLGDRPWVPPELAELFRKALAAC